MFLWPWSYLLEWHEISKYFTTTTNTCRKYKSLNAQTGEFYFIFKISVTISTLTTDVILWLADTHHETENKNSAIIALCVCWLNRNHETWPSPLQWLNVSQIIGTWTVSSTAYTHEGSTGCYSLQKRPVTQKASPCHDIIMLWYWNIFSVLTLCWSVPIRRWAIMQAADASSVL